MSRRRALLFITCLSDLMTFSRQTSCAGAATICPAPYDLDLWPFDLESGVRVTCDVGYLCAHRRRRHRAGGGTSPKFLTAEAWGAQQNLWGTCKKIKRLTKKPNIQQRKCSTCHPLATDTLPFIKSFVDHTVFYVGADSSYWAFTRYDRRTDRLVRLVCQISRTDRSDRL